MSLDFDAATLPWVDRPSFPEEAQRRMDSGDLSAEQREQLESWRQNGYLYLPGALESEVVDTLLAEYEDAWQKRPEIEVLVEDKGVQRFADVAPRSELHHHHFRLLDFQDVSPAVRRIMLHPELVTPLRAIFDHPPVAMQSLFFEYGSEQGVHQDFPYVQAEILSHLVGCWVALEDVGPDNGPLFYYPGSHRLPKFDWGGGSLILSGDDHSKVELFERFLAENCEAAGLERMTFHAQRGDVFFWHAALAHAGSPVNRHELTRKSLVIHYSSREGYAHDRRAPDREPRVLEGNGGFVYLKPQVEAPTGLLSKVKRRVRRLLD